MLSLEADAKGVSVDVFSQIIVKKSDAFSLLVRMASAMKGKANTRLDEIAASGPGLQRTETAVTALFEALEREIESAAAQWRAATA